MNRSDATIRPALQNISAEINDREFSRLVASSLVSGGALTLTYALGIFFPWAPMLGALWTLHLVALLFAAGLSLRVLWRDFETLPFARLIAVFVLGASLAFGLLPIVARDSLIYHLFVPRLWLEQRAINPISWLDCSYFSLLLSVGFAGFQALGLERLTPWYHLLYLAPTALLCSYLALFLGYSKRVANLSAAFWLTLPLVFRLSTEPMADLSVMLYASIHVVLVIFWSREKQHDSTALLSGLALGLALASKYTALFAAGLLPLAFFTTPVALQTRIRGALLCALGVVITYGIWPLRDWMWTGNPFFPFLSSLFGTNSSAAYLGAFSPFEYRLFVYGESIFEVALVPIRMALFGRDGDTRTFDGTLSPLSLAFLLFFYCWRRGGSTREQRTYFVLAGIHLLVAPFLFHALIRYHAAVAGIVTVISIGSLSTFLDSCCASQASANWKRWLPSGLIAVHLLIFAAYLVRHAAERELVQYMSSSETPDDYYARKFPEFRLARALDSILPQDSHTYLLYTGNRYHFYRQRVIGSYFSGDPILSWLHSEPSRPEDGAQSAVTKLPVDFEVQGITHIAAHEARFKSVLQDLFRSNPQAAARWSTFATEHLEPVWRGDGFIVWKLRR